MKPKYLELTEQEHKLACALKVMISEAEDPEFGIKKVAMAQHYINLAKDQLEKLVGDSYENICVLFAESEWDKTKVKFTGTQLGRVVPIVRSQVC